jgi:hypothetical protein
MNFFSKFIGGNLVKGYKKIILYTASLITAEHVIPAKAGIQACPCENREPVFKNTGFPRIKYPVSSTGQAKAGLIKPGMTNQLRFILSCIVLIFTVIFIPIGITLMDPIIANGQSQGRLVLSQETGRDPFLLPSGVRLLSKTDTALGMKGIPSKTEGKPNDILPSPLKVKTILISDHVRLALIDHHIVTIGDSIHDERVLEIKTDRVILGKGDQRRTLLLSQSPVLLTIEERKGEKR